VLSGTRIDNSCGEHDSSAMYAGYVVETVRQASPDFDATLTAYRDHFG